MSTTAHKQAVLTRAEGGAIRIYSGSLAANFNGGSGDGRYNVVIGNHRPEADWKFVDSIVVTGPGVFVSVQRLGGRTCTRVCGRKLWHLSPAKAYPRRSGNPRLPGRHTENRCSGHL